VYVAHSFSQSIRRFRNSICAIDVRNGMGLCFRSALTGEQICPEDKRALSRLDGVNQVGTSLRKVLGE